MATNEKRSMTEMQKVHNELMHDIFKDLLEKHTELWPELALWDYSNYKMSPEDFEAKDYGRFCVMHGIEHLFLVAQLRGATRDELVRILKFLMASIFNITDYAYLDIQRLKADLGIKDLQKKYVIGNHEDNQN